MKRLRIITTTLALAIAPAFAGTTAIDFTQGLTGLKHLGNTGNITVDENCNGVFGGTAHLPGRERQFLCVKAGHRLHHYGGHPRPMSHPRWRPGPFGDGRLYNKIPQGPG